MGTTTEDLIVSEIYQLLDTNKDLWTPEFLARKFWEMDSEKQAGFFNILANICDGAWSDMQWRYMQKELTVKGKSIIDNMKLHTDEVENA